MKIVRDWLWIITLLSNLVASDSSNQATFSGFEYKTQNEKLSFTNPGYELSLSLIHISEPTRPY